MLLMSHFVKEEWRVECVAGLREGTEKEMERRKGRNHTRQQQAGRRGLIDGRERLPFGAASAKFLPLHASAARTPGEVRWPGTWRSVRSLQPTRAGQMRGWESGRGKGWEAGERFWTARCRGGRPGRGNNVKGPRAERETARRRARYETDSRKPLTLTRACFRVAVRSCAEPRFGVGGKAGRGRTTNGSELLAW